MRSTALPFVLACLVAAPAAADVTVIDHHREGPWSAT